MRLINKMLLFLGLFWVAFLTAFFVNIIHYSFTNFIILSVLSAFILLFVIYEMIIKRIEQLNQELKSNVKTLDTLQPIEIKGNDEFKTIALKINQLIEIAKTEYEKKATSDDKTVILQTHYDPLTGLPNQVFFNEILNKTLNHAKRRNQLCAILIIDLNHLKKINEMFDYTTGDDVIKTIANRYVEVLRTEDILAKLDADQFAVLLNDIKKPKFASTVAEKLIKVTTLPFTVNNKSFSVSAHIGISIYPIDAESLEGLIQKADDALLLTKKSGDETYQFYTQTINIEAHEFIELKAALLDALKNDELTLYFQPQLHIKNGSINGVEALIRWIHPKLGTIDPHQIITLAEETGLSLQIGEWALREACKINKYWQTEGYEHIRISVNLSSKQFHHPDIANVIESILKEIQLHPSYLELEINEKTVMTDLNSSTAILEKIKSTGVELSLDHFGTGYTSISHLKQFFINRIKIDASFIKGLPFNPNDMAITSALIGLAHNLGLEVIATGVETAEQVEFLANQQCDMVQGYFLSHPVTADKIISQLTKLQDEVII